MGCPICSNSEASVRHDAIPNELFINCPQCGRFQVDRDAAEDITSRQRKQSWKISAWLVQYKPRVLTTEDIKNALESATPSLNTRAERVLRWLAINVPPGKTCCMPSSSTRQAGEWHVFTWVDGIGNSAAKLSPIPLIAAGWCADENEVRYIIENVLVAELGWLAKEKDGGNFYVSAKGLLHLEGRKDENSTIGFCAMWFSDGVKPLWIDVIEPAIRSAGYEPLRIDSKEHNGKIDDQIMASIRGSRFVVADFTGSRGGVYYEAGFAHGLDLPVIFMCRDGDELHFDIRQYNCIFWKTGALEDAQIRLKNRILATLGQGPLKV